MSDVTDEMVERLAVHLVNQYRAMANTVPTASLDEFSDFARTEWTDNARKLLLISFGEEKSPYALTHERLIRDGVLTEEEID